MIRNSTVWGDGKELKKQHGWSKNRKWHKMRLEMRVGVMSPRGL